MNSLQIYEIKDIQNIITGYKEQFETIDKLEKELDDGTIDIEINNIRFEINIKENISNVYSNDKLIYKEDEFINYFTNQSEYIREAVFHYVTKKLIWRYHILPFDNYKYYDDIDSLLYSLFEGGYNIIEHVESKLVYEYEHCPLRSEKLEDIVIYNSEDNIYCDLNTRSFLDELTNHLDEEEPYIVRNNYSEICEFFNKLE